MEQDVSPQVHKQQMASEKGTADIAAQERVAVGQRRINVVWEYTQSYLAILVITALVLAKVALAPALARLAVRPHRVVACAPAGHHLVTHRAFSPGQVIPANLARGATRASRVPGGTQGRPPVAVGAECG